MSDGTPQPSRITVTLTLPLPNRKLSPNARTHWAPKSKITKSTRFEASVVAANAKNQAGLTAPLSEPDILWRFHLPDNRRRDKSNLMASTKAVEDGLVDGGLIVDDSQVSAHRVEKIPGAADPRLEIVVTGTVDALRSP